jgi:hypothetical protein
MPGFKIHLESRMNSLIRLIHQWDLRVSMSPQEFRELLLSHHPDLPCFDDDIIVLFNRRICAGCLMAYPTALLVLLCFRPTSIESVYLALAFAVVSQIRRLRKNIIVQHLCRIIAGIALGFGIGGGYWAIVNGQWLIVVLLLCGAVAYTLLKAVSIRDKFTRCKNGEREPVNKSNMN